MESISFPDCLCQRAESEAIIYIYTEGLRKLESQTSSSRQYLFAPRTLGCFVPLGWALLFTLTVMTCTSGSGSGMQWNPTGDDQVSSMHEHGSRVKVVSSMTALAHQFPPPLSSGC